MTKWLNLIKCHKALVIDITNNLLQADGAATNSDDVDCILKAMSFVGEYAGVMELQKALQEWKSNKNKILACNDLLRLMRLPNHQQLDWAKLKLAHQHSGDWSMDMWNLLDGFLGRLIHDVLQQALRVTDWHHWLDTWGWSVRMIHDSNSNDSQVKLKPLVTSQLLLDVWWHHLLT